MLRLNARGLKRLNEISTKYRFRDDIEIESEEVEDFCRDFLIVIGYGLNVEMEDIKFIETVLDKLTMGE